MSTDMTRSERVGAGMTCLQFRPLERNTLRGFADLQWDGLIFRDCAVHEREGKRWVAPPARPVLDKEHALVRDETTNKLKYTPLLDFVAGTDRQRFVREALAALDRYRGSKTPATGGRDGGGQQPNDRAPEKEPF